MVWPFTRRQSAAPEPSPVDDEPRLSRRASDSTDIPMDGIFSMRIPHELRILGARKARVMGLSLGEYMRHLLAKAVDSDDENLPEPDDARALRKGRP
ncbi:hypothetical protein [Pseudothauera rhizosphaerae]|uniref:Uncharacterized protein n=1 Tax=Pseudothauera rhizosphaerae TaxID=2565932 RepID=A0A4S4AAM2_9RHOO|nr:hypothetical protein [Pseudothauera rhizosphaerae]THF55939.1 hypothetical protein E6O51_20345 [Pseudothauera rhizosphaerae]